MTQMSLPGFVALAFFSFFLAMLAWPLGAYAPKVGHV